MSFLDWLFGRALTPEELLKEQQRILQRIEHELTSAVNQHSREGTNDKTAAKNALRRGDETEARQLTASYVNHMQQAARMRGLRTVVSKARAEIMQMRVSVGITSAFLRVGRVMGRVNANMNLKQFGMEMQRFEYDSKALLDKVGHMGHTMDEVADNVDDTVLDEEETDGLPTTDSVFDEMKEALLHEMPAAPLGKRVVKKRINASPIL